METRAPPRLNHPLLRLLLCVVAIAVVQVVLKVGMDALERWATARHVPPIPIGPFVFPGATLFAVWLVEIAIGRHTWTEVGFGKKALGRDLGIGFGIGVALFSSVVGVLAIAGYFHIDGRSPHLDWLGTAFGLVVMFTAAVGEETIFRGVIFRLVEQSFGSAAGLVIGASIFGLSHLANPHASFQAAVAIAVEAGLILSAGYMLNRTLWLPIGIHWAWNFTQGPVFGSPISGHASDGFFKSVLEGPQGWTGGAFGPEAGWPAIVLCTAAGAALLLVAVRSGQWKRARWPFGKAQPAVVGTGV